LNFILQPWQLLLLILAGWINRQQQQVIDYLRTENQILKEKLGKRRILLSDDQRQGHGTMPPTGAARLIKRLSPTKGETGKERGTRLKGIARLSRGQTYLSSRNALKTQMACAARQSTVGTW
jgi:hypothetical protein